MRFTVSPFLRWCGIAAALSTAACSGGDRRAQAVDEGEVGLSAIVVSIAKVHQEAMPLAVSAIGTTEAYSSVDVHPQITGELTSVEFKEGDDVQKGDIIFTLDFRPLEAALEQAQANLQRDVAQATNARASAARYQDLLTRGIETTEDADQSRTTADALDATVQADRAVVENAKVQLHYATITAPLSGRTGTLMVHVGNLVRANDTTPIVVINQVTPIYVSFGIPEGQLPDLKRYLAQGSVRVEAAPPGDDATPSRGRITFIDNAVDPTTGQIKIKASFPNADHRLWPGQFANVTVTLSTELNAIVVPTTAVQNGQQGDYVFVVTPDMTAEMRPVTVEREVGDNTVVQKGLRGGEIVVTDGQLRLLPGAKLSIKGEQGPRSARVEG